MYDKSRCLPYVDQKDSRSRCKITGCRGFTHIFCTKCDLHLCITSKRNCFYKYHDQQKQTNKQKQPSTVETSTKNLKAGSRSIPSSLVIGVNCSKQKLSYGPKSDTNSWGSEPDKKFKYNTRKSLSFPGVSYAKQ